MPNKRRNNSRPQRLTDFYSITDAGSKQDGAEAYTTPAASSTKKIHKKRAILISKPHTLTANTPVPLPLHLTAQLSPNPGWMALHGDRL